MRKHLLAILCLVSFALAQQPAKVAPARIAPGAPGAKATWTNGNKVGVGTSITLESKVWFTLGDGVMTEVYYPTIDKANTRVLGFAVTDGRSWFEDEATDATHAIEVPDPAALVFRQVNTSKKNRWKMTKTYFTDPARDVVLMQVRFEPKQPGLKLYVYFDPAVNNSGLHDSGYSAGSVLASADASIGIALASSVPFVRTTSGYLGPSDGLTDLKQDFRLDHTYTRAANGNVFQLAELPTTAAQGQPFTLALAFADETATAIAKAKASLAASIERTLGEYSRGWHEYIATLKPVDPQYQRQYQMAAMVLRAHEDKTWRGAGAASLTVPWGNEVDASEASVGGYHLVWSRDLYQVATAFLAMGDKESADRALDYLFRVQQKKDGSFPQNSWLDGRPFWGSLQLDEVAYPLVLAYQLGRTDGQTYTNHIKPAANFIVNNGPATPQERWEEEGGYSPSTIAAEIAGLVCAAEIARRNYDDASALVWLATADEWARRLDDWTVTTTGPHGERYYVRIAQNGRPNEGTPIEINNGGGTYDERSIVDAGFLELVRLGIRRPDDPLIAQSLSVVDKVIRVETPNGPGWYRYNRDGYGEKPDGRGYDGTGVGRLWPLLAGERGEYALLRGEDPAPYLDTMMKMGNQGGMLPEQVWEKPESPAPHLKPGEGTGSATPLAWTNAQFIRLAIAAQERKLPEMPQPVFDRYAGKKEQPQGAPPRVLMNAIPDRRYARGEKFELSGQIDGAQSAAALVGTEVRALQNGDFKVPVEVGERGARVTIAAFANGQTTFQQRTFAPTTSGGLIAPHVPAPDPARDAAFAQRLRTEQSPIIEGPWATFVYRGKAKLAELASEWTGWRPGQHPMKHLAGEDLHYYQEQFPRDARLEYKLIVDGEWKLDPANPRKIDNGVGGENNFFTMPDYKPSPLREPAKDAPRGKIEPLDLPADPLGRKREVHVYLPPGYERGDQRHPVIYFGDGIEYIERAHANVIADNLIAAGRMQSAIMVFMQPLDRMSEYWMNSAYVGMVARDIVSAVDKKYRTIATPEARTLAGASLGGVISGFGAFQRQDVFRNVLAQSTACQINGGQMMDGLSRAPKMPIRMYMSVGRYEWLLDCNRELRDIFTQKGYDFAYQENNQGHTWSHWADDLHRGFEFLLPPKAKPIAATIR